jgi:hypothetical protein
MKLTQEEIEQGFRMLGLEDAEIREALSRLARVTQPKPGPMYETITATHTLLEAEGRSNAELESDSQRN